MISGAEKINRIFFIVPWQARCQRSDCSQYWSLKGRARPKGSIAIASGKMSWTGRRGKGSTFLKEQFECWAWSFQSLGRPKGPMSLSVLGSAVQIVEELGTPFRFQYAYKPKGVKSEMIFVSHSSLKKCNWALWSNFQSFIHCNTTPIGLIDWLIRWLDYYCIGCKKKICMIPWIVAVFKPQTNRNMCPKTTRFSPRPPHSVCVATQGYWRFP